MSGLATKWAETSDLQAHCASDVTLAPDVIEHALWDASYLLHNMTRQRWNGGGAVDTVRPTASRATSSTFGGSRPRSYGVRVGDGSLWLPSNGRGWGTCGCDRHRATGCNLVDERYLPGPHVTAIVSVHLNGVVVPRTNYEVHDWQWLVGVTNSVTDERQLWPCCQDVTLQSNEPNTFEVQYVYGRRPPAAWRRAAAELAYEIGISRTPKCAKKCRLPARTIAATRSGLTITMRDPDLINRVGLPYVDMLLDGLEMQDKHRPAVLVTPGQRNRVRRVTTQRGAQSGGS